MDFEQIKNNMRLLQDSITQEIKEKTGQGFHQDNWLYERGEGGGDTRVYSQGLIQKGGVNFSGVQGKMNEKIALKMQMEPDSEFSATGVSIVLHPENPFVPTCHMNVRYFETPKKWWFGGGIDLTPNYPFDEDIKHFHGVLKNVSEKYEKGAYAKYKRWCDEYFYIKHRNEMRGVGGIFFDYLSGDKKKISDFVFSVGHSFTSCYLPIVLKRKDHPYIEKHTRFQQIRRGRYVEFNLIYDRGTLFGLETGGRVESILMSLPDTAAWEYARQDDDEEQKITAYFQPRDWV